MPSHTPEELLRQFHNNQSLWLARLATGQTAPREPHPQFLRIGETTAMQPGTAGVIMLPMADDFATMMAEHDKALTWLQKSRSRDVLVWSMRQYPELDLALLAQGYAPGFDPWWMTRDLTGAIARPSHQIRHASEHDIRQLLESDVPYVIRDQIQTTRVLVDTSGNAEVTWLAAILHNKPVGHAIINLQGEHAGLFNVGVSGRHRHQGVGTSLTLAAMQIAQDHGAVTMNLNSTPAGKPLYEKTGFIQFGTGQTWIRSGQAVHNIPSTSDQALAFAIGQGNIANIPLYPHLPSRLPCGLSPQELAARYGQRESLLHIIEHGGHVPDILALWKADLKDQAIAAAADPQARELITGITRAHPIHHAVERGAGTLVLALIEAGANLSARDGEYNATPLDWAHACNKPTIARIIHQAGGR